MRVLITGGAGFVGSTLAERLLARGEDVWVVDDFTTGRRDNLADHAHLRIVEGSIADRALVDETWAGARPDVVVHAAASYRDPADWTTDALTNVVGTANVAQASQRAGVRRFVYLQTALCYGLHPHEQPITTDHPVRPEGSSYAISKTAGEAYVLLSELDAISFRLANAYGPRNFSGPLPTFYQRLAAGQPCFVADTRRDFIFVQDLVDVIELAVDGSGSAGPYHVSSGGDRSIEELFQAIVQAMGIELDEPVQVRPRDPGDAYTILLDPSRTHRDFDWQVRTPLEVGVAAAVDYYRAHGVTQTYTHLKRDT